MERIEWLEYCKITTAQYTVDCFAHHFTELLYFDWKLTNKQFTRMQSVRSMPIREKEFDEKTYFNQIDMNKTQLHKIRIRYFR